MRHIIPALLIGLAAVAAYAHKAQIRVCYDFHFHDPRGIEKHHEYMLLAGNGHSKFYNDHTQWLDSTRCTSDGENWYLQTGLVIMQQAMGKSPTEQEAILNSAGVGRDAAMYIVRDDDKFKVWDEVYYEYRKYSEPIEQRDWEVCGDSIKTILGYDCVMAEGDYHGRRWKAWFAPELPIDAGPWKLLGLPGLILEAADTTGQYRFTATGIEASSVTIPKVYEPFDYEKTTHKDFLRLCRYRYDDYQGMRNLHFGPHAAKVSPEKIEYESGKPGFDLLEIDYR